jgi:YesN/AraC family two-component response regulator
LADRLHEAKNGMDALEVLAQALTPPSVALVDLTMPVMGAAELLPVLHARYPGLKVIATSGYSEEEARRVLRSECVAGFLQKPYMRDVLVETITKVLN